MLNRTNDAAATPGIVPAAPAARPAQAL